jgi:hypothetical protein
MVVESVWKIHKDGRGKEEDVGEKGIDEHEE